MTCDVCQIEDVAFIVGNAATGEQQFLGPACMARFGLEVAKALLPAEEIAAVLGPMFVQSPQEPPSRPQEALGRRKRKRSTSESEPSQGTAGGAPEVAPAAEDG